MDKDCLIEIRGHKCTPAQGTMNCLIQHSHINLSMSVELSQVELDDHIIYFIAVSGIFLCDQTGLSKI